MARARVDEDSHPGRQAWCQRAGGSPFAVAVEFLPDPRLKGFPRGDHSFRDFVGRVA